MSKPEKILKWILFGAILLVPIVPLVISSSFYFPYIVGKNLLFRTLIEVAFLAWVPLFFMSNSYRPRKNWFLAVTFIFVAIIFVADFFGYDRLQSIWSNFERMDGFITLAHLWVYLVILISVFKDSKIWKIFFNLSLLVSVIVSFYGLAQLAGSINITQGGVRLDSTFGNAIYLAVYMLFHIFIAGFLLIKSKNNWLRSLYIATILLNLFVMFETATRGVFLGLAVSIIVMSILAIWLLKDHKKIRISSLAIILGLFIVSGGLYALRDSAIVTSNNSLNRLAHISLTDTTAKSRLMIWDIAWQGVKERPMLGWGQGNFLVVFGKYYDPQMFNQEPWFDRTHNIVFDWLIAGGFLALIAYLSIIFFAFYYIWQDKKDIKESILLTGLVVAYFVQNLFVFDNIGSHLLFFAILAYIVYRRNTSNESSHLWEGKMITTPQNASALLIISGVVSAISFYAFVYSPMLAGSNLIQAISFKVDSVRSEQSQLLLNNLEAFKKAEQFSTTAQVEAREQLSNMTINIIQNPNISNEVKKSFFDATNESWQRNFEDRVDNPRQYVLAGSFYLSSGQTDLAQTLMEKALSLSPKNQKILIQIGWIHFNKDENEKAEEFMQEAYELDSQFDDPKMYYAISLLANNKKEEALKIISQIDSDGIFENGLFQKYLFEAGLSSIVADTISKRVEVDPTNIRLREVLVIAYLRMGDRAEALEVAQNALEVDVDNQERWQYLISEIKAGRNPISE